MQKLFAVIGDPIAHSMSPAMHNDLFAHYGVDAHYMPLHVNKKDLREAVFGLKAIGVSGFNVTVPHKESIIPFLDAVDPLAESIGAVNTVVNVNGCLHGFNTDGSGFVTGLQQEIADIEKRKILIIGAGGAARGIYFALASAGTKKLDLCNRTLKKAEMLLKDCPYTVSTNIWTLQEAEMALADYEVIIQTTSIGLKVNDPLPLSLRNLRTNAFVSDIIYNPLHTLFLQEAGKKGAKIQNGLEMFVNQGALAFEKWTGIMPDTARMKKIVLSSLKAD